MGKAKPVHRDGLELWSWRRACRTATACREINQARRAHHLSMGTLRWVHPSVVAKFQVDKFTSTDHVIPAGIAGIQGQALHLSSEGLVAPGYAWIPPAI